MTKYIADCIPPFIYRGVLNIRRKYSYDAFSALLPNASKVQENWMLHRIQCCRDTTFGENHGFSKIKTLADFRKQVPVSDYSRFAPYIDAVAAGETKALIPESEKLIQFTITTGSTGTPKLNPVTDMWLRQYRRAWEVWGTKLFVDHPENVPAKMLLLVGTFDMGKTKGGYQISMVSALAPKIQNPFVKPLYLIPEIVNEIPDPVSRYYVALRLSILEKIGWIFLMSPGSLIRLAEIGNTYADVLLKDVTDGTLSAQFDIPDRIRRTLLEKHLHPQPGGACKLAKLASRDGQLLPKNYWERPVISCWLAGTAGFQSRYLADYFGDVPMRDIGLTSSEGRHTIPLQDHNSAGVTSLESGFYEFVPAESASEDFPDVLDGHQLEPGRDYRMIMSTAAGYYRYDIGDIVRCRGYMGEAPLLDFIQKSGRVCDLEGEKLTEHQIVEGAHLAANQTGVNLGLITAVPRRLSKQHPRYDFLVESSDIPEEVQQQEFLANLDRELAKLNFLWKAHRKEGILQNPRLLVLAPKEWDRCIKAEVDRRGTGDHQYKHPGLILDDSWLDQFHIASTVTGG